jgi:outer membrane protein
VSIAPSAFSQQGAGAPVADSPHKIGVIDMAFLFKNYKKFEALREDLKTEIEARDQEAKRKAENVKNLQEQMQTFKEGSENYLELEKQIAGAVADFETFRKVAQRDFMRKESQLYKQVYLEVLDVVKKYAERFNYTLIVRCNRESMASVENPQQVLGRMNENVVYYRQRDDVTQRILDYLNGMYTQSAATPAARGTTRRQ